MTIDWKTAESWLMGNAWVGSLAGDHVSMLCDTIGTRWGGSDGERRAADYIRGQFESFGLEDSAIEEFDANTWETRSASITLNGEIPRQLDVRPSLFCPPISITAPLVDVGFGMAHETEPLTAQLSGSIALISGSYEPFSPAEPLTNRLDRLASLGVAAAITPYAAGGRRTTHGSSSDWRDNRPSTVPLPLVHTSREDGGLLSRTATGNSGNVTVTINVDASYKTAVSRNTLADLPGETWPDETLLLGAHHDTTPDSPGANDNGSGTTVTLETARLLAGLKRETGIGPGRAIRFATFGSEEQTLQGSVAYVKRHYLDEQSDPRPRIMINLDELGTGSMKGVALQFPELRSLVQRALDDSGEGLRCHVIAQMDSSGDMFPFARAGIQSAMLWRWRFVGRHPDTAFGHSSSDTPDKLRIRELKEYAGLLARLLLRLSHVPPSDWPTDQLDLAAIERRIEDERGSVFRTL